MIIKVEKIRKFDMNNSLKGFADINIEDNFIIKGIRVVSGKDGLFVGMPQQLGRDGRWHNTILTIKDEMMKDISDVVLAAWNND